MDTKFKKGDLIRVVKSPHQVGLIISVGPEPRFKHSMKEKVFYAVLWVGRSDIFRSLATHIESNCEKACP